MKRVKDHKSRVGRFGLFRPQSRRRSFRTGETSKLSGIVLSTVLYVFLTILGFKAAQFVSCNLGFLSHSVIDSLLPGNSDQLNGTFPGCSVSSEALLLQQPQPMSPQHEQFSHVFFDLAISLASFRVSGSLIDFVSGQIHMLMVPEQTKIAPITANGATFKISAL